MAERRIVTVLFADVVGFTSLSEALDIEELAMVQEGYFTAVREVLERYGGHLEKFIGDAVVAVFGVPRAREDDAMRAVRAGIALHARTAAISSELGLEPGTLLLRVGCNTGEVAYDPGQGRVTGDTVNVAARLQAAAPTGRVLVGPDTALAVAEAVQLEPTGNLDLKGKEAAVRGSVVAGIRDHPSRAAALGLLRGRTVGRRADLQALEEFALDPTDEADWRLVVAPPGVGKSRLVAELRRRLLAADQPVRVLGAQCAPDATHPYQPVADLLATALRAAGVVVDRGTDAAAAAAASELVHARLAGAGVEGAAHVAEEAVNLLTGEPGAADDTPRSVRFAAWATVLQVLADGARPVWLVEDVHDAPADTLAFLQAAAEGEGGGRPRLVLTGRPSVMERAAAWIGASGADERVRHLAALDVDAAAALASELTGGAIPEALAERIGTASQGNPLFVEELLRTWLLLGVLRETYDGVELAHEPTDVQVPSTVQVLYAAQLDDLPESARSVAQHGSVMGQRFPLDGVASLGPTGGQVDDGLALLAGRALVDGPVPDALGASYEYRHALLRETAYSTLSRRDRTRLHVACATWVEDLDGPVTARADLIAQHYAAALDAMPGLVKDVDGHTRADLVERTVHWRHRAAVAALASSAFEAAREHGRRLLDLVDDTHPMRAPALEVVGVATANEDIEAGADLVEQAMGGYEAHLEREPDDAEAARGLLRAGRHLARLRYDQVAFAEAASAAAHGLEAAGGRGPVGARLALDAWRLRGRLALADSTSGPPLVEELRRVVDAARDTDDEVALFDGLSALLEYDAEIDEVAHTEVVQELCERAERLGRWGELVVLRRLQAAARTIVDTADGVQAARALPGLARSLGLREAEAFATYGVTEATTAAGLWDEALEAGDRALGLADRHNAHRARVRTTFVLAPVAAARDDTALLTRILAIHGPPDPEEELSSYGRMMVTLVRRLAGVEPPAQHEPTRADIADMGPPVSPSGAMALECTTHRWLVAGRRDDVTAVTEVWRSRLEDGATLTHASVNLQAAWSALAAGDRDEADRLARDGLRAADACGAPWWQARLLRVLEALGSATPDDIERRVRIEVGLGVTSPQLPPA